MCKIKDEIEIILKNDDSNISKAILLLSKQADNRFTAIEKKADNIDTKLKELEMFSFFSKHKLLLWLVILGVIFLLGTNVLETIKLLIQ